MGSWPPCRASQAHLLSSRAIQPNLCRFSAAPAEAALECGSASYRLGFRRRDGGSFAAALQRNRPNGRRGHSFDREGA
jgi:hypothetical protein